MAFVVRTRHTNSTVGGNDTVVDLANLPAGVYTVRAFPVSLGRWLRVEGKLLTEVPWIFAAPTGIDRETMTDKVTVYWDEVPGATGYRVRWRKSNENDYPPGNVVVVGADVRQQSVARLEREQEYYFVVEAAYNGLWGPPSEEDSAVPHEGAIPWDTQDPNQIIPAIRAALGIYDGDVSALSPDGWYYTETAGMRDREEALYYQASSGEILTSGGGLHSPIPVFGGVYRRIKTKQEFNATEAMGEFYLPPPGYINLPESTWSTTRDTPHVYFGIEYTGFDIEAGVAFHPANRGVRRDNREEGRRPGSPPPSFHRWEVFLNPRPGRRERIPVGSHDYLDASQAPYGFIIWLHLKLEAGHGKLVSIHLHAWKYLLEDQSEQPSYKRVVIGCAYKSLSSSPRSARIRRNITMAQRVQNTYRRSGTYFFQCGVARVPLFVPDDFQPIQVYIQPSGWQLWTPAVSDSPENFPASGVISVSYVQQWYREVVNIDLR
jgi:hypothetical protein